MNLRKDHHRSLVVHANSSSLVYTEKTASTLNIERTIVLRTVDLWARASMKNAANCEKPSVNCRSNRRLFERKWRSSLWAASMAGRESVPPSYREKDLSGELEPSRPAASLSADAAERPRPRPPKCRNDPIVRRRNARTKVWTSARPRRPAEFKHITKRRTKN